MTVKRVSQHHRPVPATERNELIQGIMRDLLNSNITQGQALRRLRREGFGTKQADYAKLVGVSRSTITDIENDRSNYKTEVLNKVFRPAGLKVGLIPIQQNLVGHLFKGQSDA